jgi:electron transport complex protein RnfE
MSLTNELVKGIWKQHPLFRILLGMCPTLATSTLAVNAIGMGASVIFVLVGSNLVISLFRNVIPDKVRIPVFIVIICTFVTVVDLFLHAYTPEIYKALGIFIPLIVVNCIILGRAEAFAQSNPVLASVMDGIGMGIGFTWGMLVLGTIREILGAGTWMGIQVTSPDFPKAIVMLLPAGGFITLGFMLAGMNKIELMQKEKGK